MKLNKKLIVGLVLTVLILSMVVVAVSAVLSGAKTKAVVDAIINGGEVNSDVDLNRDGKVDILDAILAVKYDTFNGPQATGITFDDDDYSIANFDPKILTYTVNLPAGRPRIPLVDATVGEGVKVKDIVQATIADTETSGIAKIIVENDDETKATTTYIINFVRSTAKNNIVLQYDDRWTFTPDCTLAEDEYFKFESSNGNVLTVDDNGVIWAKNVSETSVDITAKVMKGEVETGDKYTLTVSEVNKARINLFFVTGQSNAQGCYDYYDSNGDGTVDDTDKRAQAPTQIAQVDRPETQGRVYSYDIYPRSIDNPEVSAKTFYDMANDPRQGFASALGKTYYNLSGEKVVFYQSAYNASPIERWLDPDDHGSLAESDTNHYKATYDNFDEFMTNLPEDRYEINHRANFWLHGETWMSKVWDYTNNTNKTPNMYEKLFSAEDYTEMFLKLCVQMKEDFGVEYNNILLVRAHGSVVKNDNKYIMAALNNIRSSQYGMANTYDNIAIVSRLSDWVTVQEATGIGAEYEPYRGMMGVGDVHYNQTGHNENGRIAATNFFKSLDADTDSKATSVEIIDTNGVTRLGSNAEIEIQVGKTKRIAAFPLPEYSLEDITWKTSNDKVAVITENGLITVISEGSATITATANSGAKASIKVKGVARVDDSTVKTLYVDSTYSLNKLLPEFATEHITFVSSKPEVATVTANGIILVKDVGEAVITATSNTGAYEIVRVTGVGYDVTNVQTHYRWDFNGDLTDSVGGNDLRVSDLTLKDGYGDHYKLTPDGKLFVDPDEYSYQDSSKYYVRPDFTMNSSVTVSSDIDWVIEWKALIASNSVILGMENSNVSSGKYINYIYSVGANLRFVDSTGLEHNLPYGDYQSKNRADNKWKLEYRKETGEARLYIFVNNAWAFVSSADMGEFDATFNNVCGRYHRNGVVNFLGEFDYLDIKINPAAVYEDAHYRWDFNDSKLESTYDSNQLTLSQSSVENGATATISGGNIISTNSDKNNNKRPVYSMAEPVVLTRDYDWSIEWRANFAARSALLGREATSSSILDAAYTVPNPKYEYGLRLADDYGNSFAIPFAPSSTSTTAAKDLLQNKWNTVKLTYDSENNLMTLELKPDGAEWSTVGTYNPTTEEFVRVTFERLFGRYDTSGTINFKGTMDYMEIKTKKLVYKEAVEYNWQFTDLNSSADADENTLIPSDNAKYSLDGGKYTTTTKSDELALQKPITLDSNNDWSIEWKSNLTADSTLFGTEDCRADGVTRNHIYLTPITYGSVEFYFENNSRVRLEYVEGSSTTKSLATALAIGAENAWKVEYKKSDRTLTLYIQNAEGGWDVCDSQEVGGFTTTYTCMFGDYGNLGTSTTGNGVNLRGSVDYVKVNSYKVYTLN